MPEQAAPTWRQVIQQEAEAAGIPPALAFAIVEQESSGAHYNPDGTVKQGEPTKYGRASGFFQLMPETARGLGVDPSDPYQNIKGGIALLSELHGQFGTDVPAILAAYHGGPDPQQHGPKTQQYVQDVLARLGQAESPTKETVSSRTEKPPVALPATQEPSALKTFTEGANRAIRLGGKVADVGLRFGGGMLKEAGSALSGLAELPGMIAHPSRAVEAVKQNFGEQIGEAKRLYGEGEYGHAAHHALASVIPPYSAVTSMGDQWREGDVAGALGRATGAGLLPRVAAAAPGAASTAARGVANTGRAIVENPLEAAAGAALGAHTMGPAGIPVGAVLGARGSSAMLHGRGGVTGAIARQILRKTEKTAPETGTAVAAESPLIEQAMRQSGAQLPERLVLTPEEIAMVEQMQRMAQQRASQRGMEYAAYGKKGRP